MNNITKEEILSRLSAIHAEERSLRAQLRALEAAEMPAKQAKVNTSTNTANTPDQPNKFVRMANAIVNSGR